MHVVHVHGTSLPPAGVSRDLQTVFHTMHALTMSRHGAWRQLHGHRDDTWAASCVIYVHLSARESCRGTLRDACAVCGARTSSSPPPLLLLIRPPSVRVRRWRPAAGTGAARHGQVRTPQVINDRQRVTARELIKHGLMSVHVSSLLISRMTDDVADTCSPKHGLLPEDGEVRGCWLLQNKSLQLRTKLLFWWPCSVSWSHL